MNADEIIQKKIDDLEREQDRLQDRLDLMVEQIELLEQLRDAIRDEAAKAAPAPGPAIDTITNGVHNPVPAGSLADRVLDHVQANPNLTRQDLLDVADVLSDAKSPTRAVVAVLGTLVRWGRLVEGADGKLKIGKPKPKAKAR